MSLTFKVVIVLLGVLYTLALALMARALRRSQHLLRLFTTTPTTPIGQTPTGGLVQISGEVIADEGGSLVSPSGRPAVWWHASVIDESWDSDVEKYGTTDSRDFWLEDDSGRARISPESCTTLARTTQHGRFEAGRSGLAVGDFPREVIPLAPGVLRWAQESAERSSDRLVVLEELIAPGERIRAVGTASRGADSHLCVGADKAAPQKLVVTSYSLPELAGLLKKRTRAYAWSATFFTILCAVIAAATWLFT